MSRTDKDRTKFGRSCGSQWCIICGKGWKRLRHKLLRQEGKREIKEQLK